MLSIGTPPSSGYYTAGEYYQDQASESRWGGGAAPALGYTSGPVSDLHLQYALDGKNAKGEPVTQRAALGLKRTTGRDLTLSLPKGVSILAQGPLRKPIMEAAWKANETAMGFVEQDLAKTRMPDPETGKVIDVGDQKILYATFSENSSRAGDPGEHFHNVTANLCQGKDGKFRALHNAYIYENRNLVGAVFRAELASNLRKIGLSIEGAGKNGLIDVVGVSKAAKDVFSKRRQAILEKASESKVPPKDLSKLVMITRPPKETHSYSDLQMRWAAELSTLGHSFESLTKDALQERPKPKVKPEHVLKGVVRDLSETKSYWSKLEMYKQAFNKGVPETTLSGLDAAIKTAVKNKDILPSKDGGSFSTRSIKSREEAVIKEMRAGHLQGRRIEKDEAVPAPAFTPTDGQQRGIEHLLSSPDRPIALQGYAGVGKTTLFDIGLKHIKAAGYEIIGIAPTSSAVAELAKIKSFDRVMTTQAFNRAPVGSDKTVLIVDEASMLGTKSALSILRYANKRNLAKVAFAGDRSQLDSVEAGTPFADMQDKGMHTVVVDEIIRQDSTRHREGVKALAIGNIQRGFAALAPEIHETSFHDLEARTLDLWQKTKNAKAAIIVQTNKQKAALNRTIKSSLSLSKAAQKIGYAQKVWRPIHATQREKALTKTYEDVSHLRFHKDLKRTGVKGGRVYKVDNVDLKKHRVTLLDGHRKIIFKPAKYDYGKDTVELYHQESLRLDKGDRIRFTRGGQKQRVNNNDLGTIAKIERNSVSIELDKGKQVTLPKSSAELHHVDHGWASTGHAFQGKTVRDAIVLMPSKKSPLTTLKSLYVGASRHKKTVAIVTDNALALKRSLQKELKIRTENMPVFEHEAIVHSEPEHQRSAPALAERTNLPEVKPEADRVRVPMRVADHDFSR